MKFSLVVLFSFLSIFVNSQIEYSFENRVDVQSYHIEIEVKDDKDLIKVNEYIKFENDQLKDTLILDLQSLNSKNEGFGMKVFSAHLNGNKLIINQSGDKLILTGIPKTNENLDSLHLSYFGIPEDGLVIGKNKFGDRTFFGDNWPNRAHLWFACNDHPLDKATVRFEVTVPVQYQVIANGTLIEQEVLNDFSSKWIYQTDYVLPTKVMVIGIADFYVKDYENSTDSEIPVSAWVYPQNREEGTYDMAIAPDIITWFEMKIADYPFDKLANVQSTTRYGGMENASCIFYDEKAIDGKRTMENLIVHEIAHQWFGNSASEKSWEHLWLSEGFATYLTNVYIEETKGKEAFFDQLEKDRAKVIRFSKSFNQPVIDTLTTDLLVMLNPNAYQKGSWFLHMLRIKLGDDVFWNGIREYYEKYQYNNANSEGLEAVFENVCGCELSSFFDQWLRQSGHPIIQLKVKKRKSGAIVKVRQLQKEHFDFSLEIGFGEGEQSTIKSFKCEKIKGQFHVDLPRGWEGFRLDPNHKLLIEVR